MANNKLTKRQTDVLDYLKKYLAGHGYPPSVREIGKDLGMSSPATVQAHLNRLKEAGMIRNNGGKFRTLELLCENEYMANEDIIKVPLVGKISAGNPIEAIENPSEYFNLPSYLVPRGKTVFTLKVDGESMINKGILDGDIVIIEKRNEVSNGDVAACMTMDNEVTLKTFYKEKDHIRLQPENDFMEPFIFDNVTILGKAIGLFRKL